MLAFIPSYTHPCSLPAFAGSQRGVNLFLRDFRLTRKAGFASFADMQTISSLKEAFDYILTLKPPATHKMTPVERTFRVSRMRLFLGRFGHPDRAYQTIHIAGTKGKGSTAAFLASILNAAGYRVGLYTSPHVSDPAERISATMPLRDPRRLTEIIAEIETMLAELEPDALPGGFDITPFELVTLLAFCYFRETDCQIAVIETGIGGRCDVTNVITPIASVLTPIDYDHTEILGDTLEKIAKDKAGIIKPGVPAFCGLQPPEVKTVFRTESALQQTTIRFLDEELTAFAAQTNQAGTSATFAFDGMTPCTIPLRLSGQFQAENAALAALTIRHVFPDISLEMTARGLSEAFLPGRMEIVSTEPPIVLDAAHTPLAIRRALEAFQQMFPGEAVLIFGAVHGKNYAEMARLLAPAFREVIISTPGAFKQSEPEDVFYAFQQHHPCPHLEKHPASALQFAQQLADGRLPMLVTGSFYMVAEIRKLLKK